METARCGLTGIPLVRGSRVSAWIVERVDETWQPIAPVVQGNLEGAFRGGSSDAATARAFFDLVTARGLAATERGGIDLDATITRPLLEPTHVGVMLCAESVTRALNASEPGDLAYWCERFEVPVAPTTSCEWRDGEIAAAYARARRRHRADPRLVRAFHEAAGAVCEQRAIANEALAAVGTDHFGLVSDASKLVFSTAEQLVDAVARAAAATGVADLAVLITRGERTTMLSPADFVRDGMLDRAALLAALPALDGPVHRQGRPALAIVDDRIVELAASPVGVSRHAVERAPGLFRYLVEDGVLAMVELDELIELLPDEENWLLSDQLRDGEGFDSSRWPVAFDARLAMYAAHLIHPDTHEIEDRIYACDGLEALRRYQRVAFARAQLASGATPEMLAHFEAAIVQEALAEPPLEYAVFEAELVTIQLLASDGAYAFHAARRISPTAEAAARLVRRAIEIAGFAPWIVARAIRLVHERGEIVP